MCKKYHILGALSVCLLLSSLKVNAEEKKPKVKIGIVNKDEEPSSVKRCDKNLGEKVVGDPTKTNSEEKKIEVKIELNKDIYLMRESIWMKRYEENLGEKAVKLRRDRYSIISKDSKGKQIKEMEGLRHLEMDGLLWNPEMNVRGVLILMVRLEYPCLMTFGIYDISHRTNILYNYSIG